MPSTTNFGWTTPADTDLVKDGAAAIRTLGNGIDTSFLDLKGGTTGQVLAKNSNTDLDFTWTAGGDITSVTAGTGISGGGTSGAVTITNSMATEITAAGDIIVGTGSGTFDNLPIGTTGQVLTADTTVSPYKVKWASSGAAFVGCGLYASGDQSTTGGVDTAITFNSEYFDSDAFHDNSTNTSRITIPAGLGGKYLFAYSAVNTASAEANYNQSTLRKNGTAITSIQTLWSSVTYTTMTQTVILDLAAADYVELYIQSDANGTIKNYRTFYCQKVG